MLYWNDCHKSVSYVFSIEIFIFILEHSKFPRILVHNSCKCHLKSCHKCTAVYYIYPVAIWIYLLRKVCSILKSHFDLYIPACPLKINWFFMEYMSIPVYIWNKAFYAMFFKICFLLAVIFILKYKFEIFVKICYLFKFFLYDFRLKMYRLKNLSIRIKCYFCSRRWFCTFTDRL